jgi:hypothetical protein
MQYKRHLVFPSQDDKGIEKDVHSGSPFVRDEWEGSKSGEAGGRGGGEEERDDLEEDVEWEGGREVKRFEVGG